MAAPRRIVDNRVFLLGLDKLYHSAMKERERGELAACARRVAGVLSVRPADVPVEGYYVEDASLTDYFRLLRALQDADEQFAPAVQALPEFQRLLQVTSSALFGTPQFKGKLLPAARDALSQALLDCAPEWTVSGLATAAHHAALSHDDYSLVGLGARTQDPVVLTAVRESVVLYAEIITGEFAVHGPCSWTVDRELAEQAKRFIDLFNSLFGETLPPPVASAAERYWDACEDNVILGRCVRLGHRAVHPRHYHWGICQTTLGELFVQDFWHATIMTSAEYRAAMT